MGADTVMYLRGALRMGWDGVGFLPSLANFFFFVMLIDGPWELLKMSMWIVDVDVDVDLI